MVEPFSPCVRVVLCSGEGGTTGGGRDRSVPTRLWLVA